MEEKERYEVISQNLNGYAYIHDFKTDDVLNTYDSCDLLNQQSKRIKELEKENQQLKQQLHELPKKIVEYFYDEIRHRAILEDDYCPDHNLERKYGVRKCLLENIRTTILKKYGGEENGNSNM